MIKIENGRAHSIRTPEEVEAALAEDIAKLTPEEREALETILREMKENPGEGNDTLLNAIGEAEYKYAPVDMKTFLMDPYYLGESGKTLYPQLVDDLIELFSGDYTESIWTGAIGYGKTHVASIGMCRVLYEISCLKDPHATYGLAKGSVIALLALSVNEGLAQKVAFENIVVKLAESPYFKEKFPYEPTKKELRFPNNVWLAPRATTDTSALGLNAFGAFLDEISFMGSKKSLAGTIDVADTIYASIQRRIKSRFARTGRVPGMIFVVSSKRTQDDFVARRIKQALNDPTVFVRDYSNWGPKPPTWFSPRKFWVLCGSAEIGSRILEPTEDPKEVAATLPEGAVLVDVPMDFKADFERDLEGAIRDLAGIGTTSIRPYIQRREKIREATKPELLGVDPVPAPLTHPFSTYVYDMSKGGTFLWDRMVSVRKERAPGRVEFERLRPLVHPGAARHIHLDLGLKRDSAGFCMAHVGGWKDVVRRSDDGRQYAEKAPVYFMDVALKIVPPVGGEIVFGDIRHLIYSLVDKGFTVTCVSTDSWQSVDLRQILGQKGLNTEMVSVDTTPEPYDTMKMALYENRILMYEYQPLFDELAALEEDFTGRIRKIDHPKAGGKDVSDALAGCIYTLSHQRLAQPLPIMRGMTFSPEDAWMPEQTQATLAGDRRAVENTMLPPFLSGGGSDWSDPGDWKP